MGADCKQDNRDHSQPVALYTTVRIVFDPYNYSAVQEYLKNVVAEFGYRNRDRWYYVTSSALAIDDAWALDFKFRYPPDAVIFSLKYS
jgi:hypothetical protein